MAEQLDLLAALEAPAPELVLTPVEPVEGRDRGLDHYPTPRAAVVSLLDARPQLTRGTVLDPSCGEGAILAVARERGARTVGLEIDPGRAEAARRAGHPVTTCDALASPWPEAEALCGNPPWDHAREFAWRALAWASARAGRQVWLLLRLTFLEPAAGRGELLRAHPPDVLVLPRRPAYDGRGTDSVTSAWCGWPGEGRLVWLP